jgi:hypothetical protein
MTLIKDLIDIPERVQRGDFVLRLSEGVTRADETLRDYVVTPELKACFDNALSFIKSAMTDRTSKASYLHGSFGSGKSHFMAILHLILQGNTAARSIPELAPVITQHNEWITGKKFLLVPYHMIGARDVESGILGGYVDFVRCMHPDAPIPGVYLAEGLFKDAGNLRRTMGDEAFLAKLNEDDSAGGRWGELEAPWDPARFENAVNLPPGSEERSQLISALIRKYFGSYDTQAGARGEAFVSLDKGLSVLSKHAASLGYQGLILFLDELILWLASHAAELKFIHQEGQKLAKLVEAQTPDRPIPIISFVARQRDLRELIGDSVPGAERLNFGDALKHWEDRFHRITLEDRNLPAIAERRVLKCKSDTARAELDRAFEQTRSIRDAVMNILLTREGDREMFRKVYPFSPALVQTLIAVSSVLQRERTALKVMVQLLVDHRDALAVGDIVPVGDLFDVIAHGDEAFSPELAIHFDNAKRLYHQKLLPLLEKQHGRKEDLDDLAFDDAKRAAFRNDDRLTKTLLLAALVPQVESLRSLNAERLAALNHGTIRTPIPGREGQEVLRRCRQWAASVGEIRIGEEANPSISIQLSGVDTESIIKQAEREDNHGNRIRRVRQMIYDQVGIQGEGQFEHYFPFEWKSTRRTCVVLFKNIRELTDSSIENTVDDWKLIIDFPFDEQGRGPRDDLSRLQTFRDTHPAGTKTICWVPAFFSRDAQKDLGLLVILEHILAGERFTQYSSHLSPQDRQSAKQMLESQKSVLYQRVKSHLDAAYGLEELFPGSLDTTHDLETGERFVSLSLGFDLRPPVAASLEGAMKQLVSQALDHEFPAAPAFEAEPRGANLKKVYEVVSEATHTPDGRVPVEKGPLRSLVRSIANPLKLGEMGLDATHFVLGQHWRTHFGRKAAETGTAIDVKQVRKWIDEPKPMGLPKEVQNLVIMTYAERTNRSFLLHGGHFEPSLSDLPDACELREQSLPTEKVWSCALERAGAIFGVSVSPLRNVANARSLCTEVKRTAADHRPSCQSYAQKLSERSDRFGIARGKGDRLRTALAAMVLLQKCQEAADDGVIGVLESAEVATSASAMGECVKKAGVLLGVLESTNWEIFEAAGKLPTDKQSRAESIRSSVAKALRLDEHVCALGPALKDAQSQALKLLTEVATPTSPGPTPTPTPPRGRTVVDQGELDFQSVGTARAKLDELAALLREGRTIALTLTWRVEEKK